MKFDARPFLTLWSAATPETPPQPWVSIASLPAGRKFILPSQDIAGEQIESAGAAFFCKDREEEILSTLPLAVAVESLAELGARLGESLLIVGASPWATMFAWAGDLLSFAPLTWIIGTSDSAKIGCGRPPGCRLIVAEETGAVDELKILSELRGYSMVVETDGSPRSLEIALGAAGIKGRIALLGSVPDAFPLDLHDSVHYKGLTVVGLWKELPPFGMLARAVQRGVLGLTMKKLPAEVCLANFNIGMYSGKKKTGPSNNPEGA